MRSYVVVMCWFVSLWLCFVMICYDRVGLVWIAC